MAPIFPALLLGGPPHAGKSTLTYRLSAALRARGVEHYALRASPDGEGNWALEAPQARVRELRLAAKSDWTPHLAGQIARDVGTRHLPLLVDAGGKPSPETAQIAQACTHALLLASDLDALAPWRELVVRQGLVLLGELRSDLDGPQQVAATYPVLRGTIAGLGHERSSEGVCFDALCDAVATLFAYHPDELARAHMAQSEAELVLHLHQPIYPLPAHDAQRPWQPGELPVLLDSLPRATPLGLYGQAPNWLVAAIAAWTTPPPEIFSPMHGWITLPPVVLESVPNQARLDWQITPQPDGTQLRLRIPDSYLDHRLGLITLPPLPDERGVLLDGKLPNWLWALLARTYRDHLFVACHQIQLNGGVVVVSKQDHPQIGQVLPNVSDIQ